MLHKGEVNEEGELYFNQAERLAAAITPLKTHDL